MKVKITGIQVKKDDHLVDIYSPDLYLTQSELIRAVEALDKAKAVGEQAIAERNQLDRDLKQSLARLTSEFQQGQQQRDAEHAKVKDELTGALAQRDKTIATLGRARDSSQAAIRRNEARIQDTGISAEERQRLLAENNRLKQECLEDILNSDHLAVTGISEVRVEEILISKK